MAETRARLRGLESRHLAFPGAGAGPALRWSVTSGALRSCARLQSRVDRLELQRQHGEDALVNAPQWLSAGGAVERLSRSMFAHLPASRWTVVQLPQWLVAVPAMCGAVVGFGVVVRDGGRQ